RSDAGRRIVEFRGLLQRFLAVCETIAYAHDQGVVHRDLKPSNIMLGPYGETLVLDWGLAKRFQDETTEPDSKDDAPPSPPSPDLLAATGQVVGTPLYMSPEQAGGRPAGPAGDIFSLGVILHVILTGTPSRMAAAGAGPDATEMVGGASSVVRWGRNADR